MSDPTRSPKMNTSPASASSETSSYDTHLLDKHIHTILSQEIGQLTPIRQAHETARNCRQKRAELLRQLEETDLTEKRAKDRVEAVIKQSRPWITRFNESISPSDLLSTQDQLGLPDFMWEELFALPEAQLSNTIEAVLNILEIQVRRIPCDGQGRTQVLHLLMVVVRFREGLAQAMVSHGWRQEDRCETLLTEMLVWLGKCNNWSDITRAEARVFNLVLDEVLELPAVVVKLVKSLLQEKIRA